MVIVLITLPKRKHPRLKGLDYSGNGYYHITIRTRDKLPILSAVTVGRGLAPAEVELTKLGKVVEEQLLNLSNRYPFVRIDKFVIMPTHLHAIMVLEGETAGASPRPTLTDIICTFKSLSTRLCNQYDNVNGRKIWQTSFYDEIIRNENTYQQIWRYIDENPLKWNEDTYYR